MQLIIVTLIFIQTLSRYFSGLPTVIVTFFEEEIVISTTQTIIPMDIILTFRTGLENHNEDRKEKSEIGECN